MHPATPHTESIHDAAVRAPRGPRSPRKTRGARTLRSPPALFHAPDMPFLDEHMQVDDVLAPGVLTALRYGLGYDHDRCLEHVMPVVDCIAAARHTISLSMYVFSQYHNMYWAYEMLRYSGPTPHAVRELTRAVRLLLLAGTKV